MLYYLFLASIIADQSPQKLHSGAGRFLLIPALSPLSQY